MTFKQNVVQKIKKIYWINNRAKMSYAAVLKPQAKPKKTTKTESLDRAYAEKGWANLRTSGPLLKPEKSDAQVLDARLKEAAVLMRRRWDRWNADHGIEYDYDRECSCSEGSSDADEDDFAGADDPTSGFVSTAFDHDYQYIKKVTLVNH
jgi:hypothetical protein